MSNKDVDMWCYSSNDSLMILDYEAHLGDGEFWLLNQQL